MINGNRFNERRYGHGSHGNNNNGNSNQPRGHNSHVNSLLRKSDNSAKLEFVESMDKTEIMRIGPKGKTLLNNAITYGDDMVRASIISRFGIDFVVEKGELKNIINRSGPILRTMIEVVLRESAKSANSAIESISRAEDHM